MPAAYQNQYMDQGSTFNSILTLTDNSGFAYNLVGFSVMSSAKYSYYNPNTVLQFATSITDAANGIVQISANNIQTSLVSARDTLVYDVLLIENSTNNVTRVLEGQIFVNPGVTGITNGTF